jgi:leader peptidase (prepilin peptidase)/N-methyltransferase
VSFIPEPVAAAYVTLVGLVVGSFLNVCIHRLPLGLSVVRPRSRCPGCGKGIRWYQNVPIISWIALRGRCAECGQRISWRYPAVEALSGALVLGAWLLYGLTPAFPISAGFALALLVLFFTDYDHKLLPDAVTLTGFVAGLAVAWFNPFLDGEGWSAVWSAVSGAGIGSGLLWGFGAAYGKLRGVEAMGLGDVKMMAMVGAFTGPAGVLFTIFGGSIVGSIVGVAMVPLKGRSLQDTLPFGCFLAPAALVALLYARKVAEFYLGIVIPTP